MVGSLPRPNKLNIGGRARPPSDFRDQADSRVFRTTGSFKDGRDFVRGDDQDVPKSTVQVVCAQEGIPELDTQQTA